ncbi:MAG: UvrD-helicase domain-containing protein [Phycisphaeraceae bacterium]
MNFRIADTFSDSLAKLAGNEQKAVKTTAFDMQMNPANPGMKFHRVEKAKDGNFWSVRVNRDVRLIVHKTEASLLLCYVGHHDDAYRWTERRKIERHPRTGAAQLVEVRETVREVVVPQYVAGEESVQSRQSLFEGVSDDDLLAYGVPTEWLEDVRAARTEDMILEVAEHLPREAAEAVLDLATGRTPTMPERVPADADPFQHPDAQRRFRVMTNVEELERALEYPWEKWTVFLHPAQRELVERKYNGPARISGSAGTGKTIVALHRAVYLARKHAQAKVLIATFSETLANALRIKLDRLAGNEPMLRERITVDSVDVVGRRLYEKLSGEAKLADEAVIRPLLRGTAEGSDASKFPEQFLWAEWRDVVDAWQLETWEAYRDVPRLGRKKRLGEKQRLVLWQVFEQVRQRLESDGLVTMAAAFAQVASRLADGADRPFDFAVIDEAQDVGVAQLRFLASLAASRPDGIFFTGDLGQRIFQSPFSWKALGVDIRGRSHTLRINYRTSHQIRRQADRLLAAAVADVDGNVETRDETISTFNGPPPVVEVLDSEEAEISAVAAWLKARLDEGLQPDEIGVFVRSADQLNRAHRAVRGAGSEVTELDHRVAAQGGRIAVGQMHLAKGLEFRAVAVMACDDEVVPLQARIETVTDDSELEEVYHTERHLLYVACTRARDHLYVTAAEPASEFLYDMVR